MTTMQPGRLRQQVAIQARTRTSDGQGGATDSWVTLTAGTVWAAIEPASGAEVFAAHQLQQRVTHKVTLRYREEITTAHRLLYGSRVLNIRSVLNPEERQRYLVVMVEEGVPA